MRTRSGSDGLKGLGNEVAKLLEAVLMETLGDQTERWTDGPALNTRAEAVSKTSGETLALSVDSFSLAVKSYDGRTRVGSLKRRSRAQVALLPECNVCPTGWEAAQVGLGQALTPLTGRGSKNPHGQGFETTHSGELRPAGGLHGGVSVSAGKTGRLPWGFVSHLSHSEWVSSPRNADIGHDARGGPCVYDDGNEVADAKDNRAGDVACPFPSLRVPRGADDKSRLAEVRLSLSALGPPPPFSARPAAWGRLTCWGEGAADAERRRKIMRISKT